MKKKTVQDQLHEAFAVYKDRIAIEYGTIFQTYAQLDKESNYIANCILSKGLKKKTLIGILTNDRLDFVTLIIGILKAGCIFVPLDTANPDGRLEVMIQTIGLKYIFVDPANLDRFEHHETLSRPQVEWISFNGFIHGENTWFTAPQEVLYDPEDHIYIYFTSGSTGIPKALLGKNKSLRHFIDWETETFNITNDFRISQFITPGFDAFLRDVFVPLCSGGRLCIPQDKDIILDAEALIEWLEIHQVNLMHGIPSFFRLLSTHPLLNENIFKSIKYVLLSGEKIKSSHLVRWYDIYGGRIQIVNLYGPTETTMIKSCYLIQPTDIHRKSIPIGKAIRGSQIIILDENNEVCEKLVTGEIHIRTPFRTSGYYNHPELTRQRFIPNPFTNGNDPHDLFYKTGDLGRELADGNIELMGRLDRQIKIRGIRIELEEIENILLNHPLVDESVVVKQELSGGNEVLVAYITKTTGEEQNNESLSADIKEYLSGTLPEYMVPGRIILMESIPLKPNGKIDYEMLPDPFPDDQTDVIPPTNNCQAKLVAIWSQVLGTRMIGLSSSFFELGGHSLNIMSLISHIHKEFEVKIALGEIFKNPTVKMQASLIQGASQEKYIAIRPVEHKEYYPLSSAQKRMYMMQQLDENSTAYNMIRDAIEMEGDIDRDRMEEILRKLIERHESLRTSFRMINGEPLQEIHQIHKLEFHMEYHEKKVNQEKKSGLNHQAIIKNFIRPFDLAQAPLIRIGLVKTGESRYLLMTDMHHIISDGLSLEILIKDFGLLYQENELPPLKLHYKDFSQWQNSPGVQQSITQQETYWLKKFDKEIPVLSIPTDYPRPVIQSFAGSTTTLEVGKEETQALNRIALEEGATMNMLLFAVYNVLLGKISGQEDIVVGVPIAERRHADLEKIIGLFVNSLTMRNYPRGEHTFSAFLKDVKFKTLEDFENQDYQFESLVDRLLIERDPSRNPLFDATFKFTAIDKVPGQVPKTTPGLSSRQYECETVPALMDLALEAIQDNSRIRLNLEYCTRLYKKETADIFLKHFKTIVMHIVENKDIKIKNIELVEEDRKVAIQAGIQDDMERINVEFNV
jgi:amino acid adenylation domain-containing protein